MVTGVSWQTERRTKRTFSTATQLCSGLPENRLSCSWLAAAICEGREQSYRKVIAIFRASATTLKTWIENSLGDLSGWKRSLDRKSASKSRKKAAKADCFSRGCQQIVLTGTPAGYEC
jgi:hypothetical protein